jgi:hypothetical protein
LFDQRIDVSRGVPGDDGGMDGAIESCGVGESLVSQMMGFEIMPDNLDVVEFGRILGQPHHSLDPGPKQKIHWLLACPLELLEVNVAEGIGCMTRGPAAYPWSHRAPHQCVR